jgi:hypothetical protein
MMTMLVEIMLVGVFSLVDAQFVSSHDERFGAGLVAVGDRIKHEIALLEHAIGITRAQFKDGFGDIYPEKTASYAALADDPDVATICEIGFNAGHSAVTWLVASSAANVRLVSFDIGWHDYGRRAAAYVERRFGAERFAVVWGDSRTTVPAYARQRGYSFECDVVHIDGNHDYEYALADLRSMLAMSHRDTRLLVDDTNCMPSCGITGPTAAWRTMLDDGQVLELRRIAALPAPFDGRTTSSGSTLGRYRTSRVRRALEPSANFSAVLDSDLVNEAFDVEYACTAAADGIGLETRKQAYVLALLDASATDGAKRLDFIRMLYVTLLRLRMFTRKEIVVELAHDLSAPTESVVGALCALGVTRVLRLSAPQWTSKIANARWSKTARKFAAWALAPRYDKIAMIDIDFLILGSLDAAFDECPLHAQWHYDLCAPRDPGLSADFNWHSGQFQSSFIVLRPRLDTYRELMREVAQHPDRDDQLIVNDFFKNRIAELSPTYNGVHGKAQHIDSFQIGRLYRVIHEKFGPGLQETLPEFTRLWDETNQYIQNVVLKTVQSE